MNKVARYSAAGILVFTLLSCSAFPAGRSEQPRGQQELRAYWVLDGGMSAESAQMFLERYLLPTSLAVLQWTAFSRQADDVRLDTRGGYRIVRKQRVKVEPLGAYAVHVYDLILDIGQPARAAAGGSAKRYELRFSYPDSVLSDSAGVLPQPLEQALLAGIRKDGRSSGQARVEKIEYLGAGSFRATVLVAD